MTPHLPQKRKIWAAGVLTSRSGASASRARLALTLIAVLAFALQGVVTKLHTHDAAGHPVLFAAFDGAKTPPPSDNKAPGNAPGNCPFCHAMAYAGSFLAPSVLALFVPTPDYFGNPLATGVSPRSVLSHFWHGRAPPLL